MDVRAARGLNGARCRGAHRSPAPRTSLRCLGQEEGVAESLLETSTNETPFSLETAVLLAGFAFETYNTPDTVRWERGEEGIHVALLSDTFIPSVYKGVLTVRLLAVEGLREETGGASEALLTGGRSDPYVLLNALEDGQSLLTKSAIATGSINERRKKQSLDVKRSSTLWRGGGPGRAEWEGEGNGEVIQLYLVDPVNARLGIRVMDECVAGEDQLLGASELDLRSLILQENGSWTGSVPLVYKDKNWDWGMGVAGLAASTLTGIATGGASLAVGAAAMVFKAVSPADQAGTLHLELNYQALEATLDHGNTAADTTPDRAPKGATPGVDWSKMCEGVGGIALTASGFDFLGFVSNEHTSTEVGLWRDTACKRIVLAFRGTEMTDIKDFMVDADITKTAWARREKDEPEAEDTEALVHAGFRAALDSVAQRLKALLNQAVGGRPEEWHLFVTGHSLGGALATLMAMDISGGLDATKGLPVAPKQQWLRTLFFGKPAPQQHTDLPKFSRLSLYTFGAPRVGNAAFAAALNAAVPEAFRVVNSQDIVTRAPRGFFQHSGRTALLFNASSEQVPGAVAAGSEPAIGLWVEGESRGQCPLRDDAVLRNPLDKESLLGKLYSTYEEGSLSAVLAAAAERLRKATDKFQDRLGSTSGAAQAEIQQLAADLQAANKHATELGKQLAAARRNGAAKEDLSALEAQAEGAVASYLQRAVEGAGRLVVLSGLQLGAQGTSEGSVAAKSGLREVIAALGDAQAAAAASAGHMAQGIGRINWELGQKIASASFGDFMSIIGIDAAYADNEVQLLKAIGTGQAITQHLEPSYHDAMWSVVRAPPGRQGLPE